jgi:cell division protease FtsH
MAMKNPINNKKDSTKNKDFMSFMADQKNKQSDNLFQNIFIYIFIFIGVLILLGGYTDQMNSFEEKPLNEVLSLIEEGKVKNVVIAGDTIELVTVDDDQFSTKKETGLSFSDLLQNNNLEPSLISGTITVEDRIDPMSLIIPIATIAIPLLFLYFIFKQMKGAGGDVLKFGQSKAKRFRADKHKVSFDDVAGNVEAKKDLYEIVDFLKNPEKYRKLGARIPRGVLLVGSAGVGKTLLAKAVAGEANVPFYSVAGSEFMEMLVGVGSARARDLFAKAKASQPSLIFIDEIDAIGRQRGSGIGGGHDEREQTLNQILIEMDGFDNRTDVIVLGATNRPDMLDKALVRPGRFDRRVHIPLPDVVDREAILKVHMKNKPFETDVDINILAKKTMGASGADLENILNEAAIITASEDKVKIGNKELDEALLKVSLGSKKRDLQTKDERRLTANHELGHAFIGQHYSEYLGNVERITIVPRGQALGHANIVHEKDIVNVDVNYLRARISMALGGRAAEEILDNIKTAGASSDIDKATALARDMVTKYGMSTLGPIAYHGKESHGWVAKEIAEHKPYSEALAAKIDKEVEKIIFDCLKDAKSLIKKNKKSIERIVDVLMEKETLLGNEFRALLKYPKAKTLEEALELSANDKE